MTSGVSSAKNPTVRFLGKSKMRKCLKNIAVAAIAATLSLALAGPVLAHAVIVAGRPTVSQVLPSGKLPIRLEFNERIDKVRSRLQLKTPAGTPIDIAIEPAGDSNVVTAGTGDFPPGAYVLRWQVLAADGHITRGDIPFTLGN